MTARERLPSRRRTFKLEVAGLHYVCCVGPFDDGRIAELFLTNHRSNSTADTAAHDAAVTFSFAVQHGADPEKIRQVLCRNSARPETGPHGMALNLLSDENP